MATRRQKAIGDQLAFIMERMEYSSDPDLAAVLWEVFVEYFDAVAPGDVFLQDGRVINSRMMHMLGV